MALKEKNCTGKEYILDGHLCLLDDKGVITRINRQFFEQMSINAIVILTEKAEVIARRIYYRDGIITDLETLELFQKAEKDYAQELSAEMNVPLHLCEGEENFNNMIDFIQMIIDRNL